MVKYSVARMDQLTVKVRGAEVPPPGVGLNTVTGTAPADAMLAFVTAAMSLVVETKVVVRSTPFHRTTDLVLKPVPLTVRTKSDPPWAVDVGVMLVVVGTGLLNVRVLVLETPPTGAGVDTVISALPAVAMSDAGMDAVSWVAETYFVVRLDPFH